MSGVKAVLLLPLRRSHQRYPINKIISYRHKCKHFLTLTLDLGLDGMKIKTHRYLPEGEYLDFKLVLGRMGVVLKLMLKYQNSLKYLRYIYDNMKNTKKLSKLYRILKKESYIRYAVKLLMGFMNFLIVIITHFELSKIKSMG